mgnify:CR=1 FL=1
MQLYSSAQFVEDVCPLIDDMHARGKTPILVGGTILYFKSLLEGLADNLPNADQAIRDTIIAKAEQESWQAVYDELVAVDPIAGQKFKVSDRQRIIRALEVYRITGEPITKLQAEQPKNQPYRYNFYNYALMPDRLELHKRIELRLQKMWEIGFLNEVEYLIGKYNLSDNLPSGRSVGYRQALEFLKNSDKSHNNKLEMEDKCLFATRQLAKRQYTWLRSLQEAHQFITFSTTKQAQEDLRNLHR